MSLLSKTIQEYKKEMAEYDKEHWDYFKSHIRNQNRLLEDHITQLLEREFHERKYIRNLRYGGISPVK